MMATNDNLNLRLATKQLLSLVRSSLWDAPIEQSLFADQNVDWVSIGRMSMEQAVGILVMQAALSLPDDLLPPKEWILKAYTIIERNRRTHSILDKSVAEAVARLRFEGIESILLKGQAYARAYQSPTLRQCGDIDLYVGDANYYSAYHAVNRYGWECEENFYEEAKHYGCKLNGIRIELHRIAGQLPTKKANRKFQEWSQRQLAVAKNSIEIKGEKITVPTPLFTVIFVFMHMYLHFLNGGVGLRQVCDWTMLLHEYHKDINIAELEKLLKSFRLLRSWRLFTPIAVDHLGLPQSECPLYSNFNPKLSSKILSFILKEGNFGRALHKSYKRPVGYLAGKIYSFRINSIRMKSKFAIDPYTILSSHVSYIYKGIKRILLDNIRGSQ